MKLRYISSVLLLSTFAACSPENSSRSRGAITLGDSSIIVTETDTNALIDVVPDLRVPVEQMPEAPTTAPAETNQTNTPVSNTVAAAQNFSGDGLQLSFQELTVFFPGISAKSYSKGDLKKARSASFQLVSGKLAGGKMQLAPAAGSITKVTQRYESTVGLLDGSTVLTLDGLGKYRSDWKALSLSGNAYELEGLEQPEFHSVSAGTFKNAVQQKAHRERMSRKESQALADKARNYKNVQQAPARISLSAVLWRIEGQDAAGKRYTKELRMDLPK